MSDPARYRFGPLERRGLIGGWRGGQLVAAASGLVLAVFVLRSHGNAVGFAVGFLFVCAGFGAGCVPVRGRTVEQWLPLLLSWTAETFGSSGGRYVVGSKATPAGPLVSSRQPRAQRVPGRANWHPPSVVAGCSILGPSTSREGLRLGVLRDAEAHTYTAVVALRGHSFALLGEDDKQRRVAAWSSVLAAMAREGSLVYRVQWLERCLPDDGSGVARHAEASMASDSRSSAARSYMELIAGAGPVTRRHQVLLSITVRPKRKERSPKPRAESDGDMCLVLEQEVRSLIGQLSAAEVTVEGPFSPRALCRALAVAVDANPTGASEAVSETARAVPGWPWPVGTELTWASYRTDASWHATYWIAEWPRVDVTPDFLAPLLLQAGARRTLSVTMEPVGPSRAAREVEAARTADLADSELRRRGGFRLTARRRREEELVIRRETELADGHAQFRYSGYVTVTARSEAELETACREVEQAAGQSRLELRRLYGQQDRAFTWTLPLGRGLS